MYPSGNFFQQDIHLDDKLMICRFHLMKDMMTPWWKLCLHCFYQAELRGLFCISFSRRLSLDAQIFKTFYSTKLSVHVLVRLHHIIWTDNDSKMNCNDTNDSYDMKFNQLPDWQLLTTNITSYVKLLSDLQSSRIVANRIKILNVCHWNIYLALASLSDCLI